MLGRSARKPLTTPRRSAILVVGLGSGSPDSAKRNPMTTNLTVVNREQLPRAAASLAASGSTIGSCSLCISGNDTRRAVGDHQVQSLAAGVRGGKTVSNRATRDDGTTNTMGAVTLRSAENESAQRGESHRAPRTNAVCAWCGAALPNVDGLAEGEVTHGICEGCYERELAEWDEEVCDG